MLKKPDFVADEIVASAPPLPKGRPPTKKEVWDHYVHTYKDRKPFEELKTFCREAWAWMYLEYVNFHDWRKQPDWVEGDEIVDAAVPNSPFEASSSYVHEVERLWLIATGRERRAA